MKTLLLITTLLTGLTVGHASGDTNSKRNAGNRTHAVNINTTVTETVLVSATELGFTDTTSVAWDDILDSAVRHGYQVCPPQTSLDLYMLLLHVDMSNLPNCNPLFVGMNEVSKAGNSGRFVYCMKTKDSRENYKLAYAQTDGYNKKFKLMACDMFVFQRTR